MLSAAAAPVIMLLFSNLLWIGLLVAVSPLASRHGQKVRKMTWSFRHGFSAEFFDSKKKN